MLLHVNTKSLAFKTDIAKDYTTRENMSLHDLYRAAKSGNKIALKKFNKRLAKERKTQ